MSEYKKLNGETVLLDKISPREAEAFEKLNQYFQEKPDVLEFTLYRMRILSDLYGRRHYNESITKPIFQVAQDMGQRLDYQQHPEKLGDTKNERKRSSDRGSDKTGKTTR